MSTITFGLILVKICCQFAMSINEGINIFGERMSMNLIRQAALKKIMLLRKRLIRRHNNIYKWPDEIFELLVD